MKWTGISKSEIGIKNFALLALFFKLLLPLGDLIAQDGKQFNEKYMTGNVLLQECTNEEHLKTLSQDKIEHRINLAFDNAIALSKDYQKEDMYAQAHLELQRALNSAIKVENELNFEDAFPGGKNKLNTVKELIMLKILENREKCGKHIISQISSPYTSARERAKILEHVFIKHGMLKLVQDENQYKAIEVTLINKTKSEYKDFVKKEDYKNTMNLLEQMRLFGEVNSFDGLASFCEKKIVEAEEIFEDTDKKKEKEIVFSDSIAQNINKQMESRHVALGEFIVGNKSYVASFEIASSKDINIANKDRKFKEDLGARECLATAKAQGLKLKPKRKISLVQMQGLERMRYFIMVYYEIL